MKKYPWLIKPYQYLIYQHKIKKAHHAVLINTQKNMGELTLCFYISKWILCLNKKDSKFCNLCHSCNLVNNNIHPDCHYILVKNNHFISIEEIHILNNKIFTCSQQGGAKIIVLSDINQLTESAKNAFLKTLEEPPTNTWFFLIDYNDSQSHKTLISRCIIYNLPIPTEKKSVYWLKTETIKKNISYITALRINQGSPIAAKNFINSETWNERIYFCQSLFNAIHNKNLFNLLPILNDKYFINKINWICLLLFDAIKLNFTDKKHLSNLDQIELITFLVNNYSNKILDKSMHAWMVCKHKLISISGINVELLLVEQLLIWEKILYFSCQS